MFVTCRPRGAKRQVKGDQGPAGQPHFELARAGTWRLCSHVSLEEDPMPERQWKPGGVGDRPCGWLPSRPSPPNRLNEVGASSPLPLYKDPHDRIHL
jgi:hypothetical protein